MGSHTNQPKLDLPLSVLYNNLVILVTRVGQVLSELRSACVSPFFRARPFHYHSSSHFLGSTKGSPLTLVLPLSVQAFTLCLHFPLVLSIQCQMYISETWLFDIRWAHGRSSNGTRPKMFFQLSHKIYNNFETVGCIEKCCSLKPILFFYFQQNACNLISILNRTKEYLVHNNEVRKTPINVNEDRLMHQILIALG